MRPFIIFLALLFFACTVETTSVSPALVSSTFPAFNSSIAAIKARVEQSENGFMEFSPTEDTLWVEAYVTSSDEAGNFYKELYVQNRPEVAEMGLKILIDRTALSDFLPPGRKIAVCLNGLGAGLKGNVLTLGTYLGNDIGAIPQFVLEDHFVLGDSLYNILPRTVQLASLTEEDFGQWIRLEDVQFAKAEVGKTFSGEAFDEYDGERRLVQCDDQRAVFLSSSTYADFKSVVLSNHSGSVEGVLTKDYYGEKPILKINDPSNLELHGSRCDPYFEQNFETLRLGLFTENGWTNYAEEGTQYWEVFEDEYSLGQSIALGSYRSGDAATISWLITPKIDLTPLTNPHLAFRTSVRYADNSSLEAFISSDWNGEVSALKMAHWEPLAVRIAESADDASAWIDAVEIPLISTTQFHLAFRYTGSGKTASDGTYEVDDIRVYDR